MPTDFLHGVEVVEIDTGPRPIRTVRSAVIGIVGTAPDADADAFPLNQPVVVAGSRLEAAKLDTAGNGAGTLPAALDAIFDQIGALVIVVRVEEGVDIDATLANVIGGVDAGTGAYTGVHALAAAESIVGFQPRIVCAPNFTHVRPAGAANPVVAELIGIADRLRAVVIADGPNTNDADAITYRGDWGSPRVYIVDPWVTRFDPVAAGHVDMPASAHVAGLIAKIDNDRGFWWSPSNHVINGIVGTSRPVDFVLGDSVSRANLLNEQQVATIIRSAGFKLWGNRTTSSDPKWAFLNVRRTADLIEDSVMRAHMWAVDRNITKTYVEDVVEGVNAYLRFLVNLGALVGGVCYANPDLNTPDQTAQGRVYFDFDFTAPVPAERVTFRASLVNDYLEEIFS